MEISMDIKIKEFREKQAKEGRKHWSKSVLEEYHEFPEVFEKTSFDKLPQCRSWDHAIDFIEGADILKLNSKVYPLSPEEMNKFINENLATGRIIPSKSLIASPFFFVKKKTGDLRPVQDYRKLNDITVKNCHPLSLIQELIDKL